MIEFKFPNKKLHYDIHKVIFRSKPRAKRDDLISLCFLLACTENYDITIEKKENPTPEEISDPKIMCVGFMNLHDPKNLNFGPLKTKCQAELCTFSNIMLSLHTYSIANFIFPWFDSLFTKTVYGPKGVLTRAGVSYSDNEDSRLKWLRIKSFLSSPIENSLLHFLESKNGLIPGLSYNALFMQDSKVDSAFRIVMQEVGNHIRSRLLEAMSSITDIVSNSELLKIEDKAIQVLDLSKVNGKNIRELGFTRFYSWTLDAKGSKIPLVLDSFDEHHNVAYLRKKNVNKHIDLKLAFKEPEVVKYNRGILIRKSTPKSRVLEILGATIS